MHREKSAYSRTLLLKEKFLNSAVVLKSLFSKYACLHLGYNARNGFYGGPVATCQVSSVENLLIRDITNVKMENNAQTETRM